ncbi:hypothetical protein C8R44DRAFT_872287 [Mycena epipterygia]|nr:hypothetical protein C8R44DRAFT_872287 [Mycena epipterygia]
MAGGNSVGIQTCRPRAPWQHLTVPSARRPRLPTVPPSSLTHALAIAPAGKDVGAPHAIFPVHAVVLAAHCAPPPSPASRHLKLSSLVLPMPLARLSPQTFAILHGFLSPLPPAFLASLERPSNAQDATYATILSALASGTARHTLAAHLHTASGGSLSAFMGHAGHVKELWPDMVALGLYDAPLCDALYLACDGALGALNLAAAQ